MGNSAVNPPHNQLTHFQVWSIDTKDENVTITQSTDVHHREEVCKWMTGKASRVVISYPMYEDNDEPGAWLVILGPMDMISTNDDTSLLCCENRLIVDITPQQSASRWHLARLVNALCSPCLPTDVSTVAVDEVQRNKRRRLLSNTDVVAPLANYVGLEKVLEYAYRNTKDVNRKMLRLFEDVWDIIVSYLTMMERRRLNVLKAGSDKWDQRDWWRIRSSNVTEFIQTAQKYQWVVNEVRVSLDASYMDEDQSISQLLRLNLERLLVHREDFSVPGLDIQTWNNQLPSKGLYFFGTGIVRGLFSLFARATCQLEDFVMDDVSFYPDSMHPAQYQTETDSFWQQSFHLVQNDLIIQLALTSHRLSVACDFLNTFWLRFIEVVGNVTPRLPARIMLLLHPRKSDVHPVNVIQAVFSNKTDDGCELHIKTTKWHIFSGQCSKIKEGNKRLQLDVSTTFMSRDEAQDLGRFLKEFEHARLILRRNDFYDVKQAPPVCLTEIISCIRESYSGELMVLHDVVEGVDWIEDLSFIKNLKRESMRYVVRTPRHFARYLCELYPVLKEIAWVERWVCLYKYRYVDGLPVDLWRNEQFVLRNMRLLSSDANFD